jgi:hypothetical protein
MPYGHYHPESGQDSEKKAVLEAQKDAALLDEDS